MYNREDLYSLMPNPCSENRTPPAKKHIPSTSTAHNVNFLMFMRVADRLLTKVTEDRTNH